MFWFWLVVGFFAMVWIFGSVGEKQEAKKVSQLNALADRGIDVETHKSGEVESMGLQFGIDVEKYFVYEVNRDKSQLIDLMDVMEVELIEDGGTISQAKGSVGRALVGGALAGGAGAIVGGSTGKVQNKAVCSELRIHFKFDDFDNPYQDLWFIDYTNSSKPGIEKSETFYRNRKQAATDLYAKIELAMRKINAMTEEEREAFLQKRENVMKSAEMKAEIRKANEEAQRQAELAEKKRLEEEERKRMEAYYED